MTACSCDTHTSTTSTPALTCTNSSTGQAIFATASGNTATIQGNATGTGANAIGIYATSSSTTAPCVWGEGGGIGVEGLCHQTTGIGVKGQCDGSAGTGVYAQGGASGYGVYAVAAGGRGVFTPATCNFGIYALGTVAVYGESSSSTAPTAHFVNTCATPQSSVYAVQASCASPGYAGWFQGLVNVTGFLSKSGGGYKIDHPSDPENKYLNHCFVESPEMMNVYRGRAVFDANGETVVKMPSYFETANENPEYMLTPIGAFMPMFVAEEMKDGSFKIAGGLQGKSVSWQVSTARADKWAKENHPGVEVEKENDHKGKFMHPELFGHDHSKLIGHVKMDKK